MKPVLRITFHEYADLEKMLGKYAQYIDVPSEKEGVIFCGISLTEVIVTPWGYSERHIEKYGEPVKQLP